MACEFCSPRSWKKAVLAVSFPDWWENNNNKKDRESDQCDTKLLHRILWYHLTREAGCSSAVCNHRNRKCYLEGRRKYTKSTMPQTWQCPFKMFLNLFNTPLLFTTPWEHAPLIATCKSRKTKPGNLFSYVRWLFSHTQPARIIKLPQSSLTWSFLLQPKMSLALWVWKFQIFWSRIAYFKMKSKKKKSIQRLWFRHTTMGFCSQVHRICQASFIPVCTQIRDVSRVQLPSKLLNPEIQILLLLYLEDSNPERSEISFLKPEQIFPSYLWMKGGSCQESTTFLFVSFSLLFPCNLWVRLPHGQIIVSLSCLSWPQCSREAVFCNTSQDAQFASEWGKF